MSATFFGDFANAVVGGTSIRATAARTADANGTGIDFLTAEGSLFAILSGGDIDTASTDETYTIKFEESDDNSTFVAMSGVTMTQTADNTDKYLTIKTRTKRYVRAVLDVEGTTPSWLGTVFIGARKKITGSGTGYVS